MYMAEAGLDNPLNCGARQNATSHPSRSEFRYRRPEEAMPKTVASI